MRSGSPTGRCQRALRFLVVAIVMAGWCRNGTTATGGIATSADATIAWVLKSDGSIRRVDLDTGDETTLQAPEGAAGGIVAIALAQEAGRLFAIASPADGRGTTLLELSPSTGEVRGSWEAKGHGRHLAVTPDGTRACIVGIKGGARAAGRQDADWNLLVVDTVTGEIDGPVVLGSRPFAIALRAEAGAASRLLVAARDRLASYTLDPLAPGWFYRSPGENRDLDVADASPVVCALRDGALVIVDPDRWPRLGGRVLLQDDDATTVLPVSGGGLGVALSRDGAVAAVLHEDGRAVSLIDVRAGTLVERRPVEGMPDLVAGRMPVEEGVARLVLASSGRGPTVIVSGAVPPPADHTDPGPEPAVPEKTAATPTPETIPEAEAVPDPPAPPQAAAAAVAPDAQPPVAETEPTRPSPEARLSGRITGEVGAAREILFYGPGNIIRLHARAIIAPDGTFGVPLPPPGVYRVIVAGEPGLHLFTRPEFRTLVVSGEDVPEGRGIEGIDFEVRGHL